MTDKPSILNEDAVNLIKAIFPLVLSSAANGALSYGFDGLKKLKHYFVEDENEIKVDEKFLFEDIYKQFKAAYNMSDSDDSHLFAFSIVNSTFSKRYQFKKMLPSYNELKQDYKNTSGHGRLADNLYEIILNCVPEMKSRDYNIYKIIVG